MKRWTISLVSALILLLICLPTFSESIAAPSPLEQVKDIFPGPSSSGPDFSTGPVSLSLTNVNGTLFFVADDGIHGKELWKSNGTQAGTVLVKDLFPGSLGSDPIQLTDVNGTLFFRAVSGASGLELWKTDGTEAGTVLVKDINPAGSSSPSLLTNVNGTLFFRANDGTNGTELWKSDGTEAGTVLVKDIDPAGHSFPNVLTDFNGTLFFRADDGTNGVELWKSDGTEAGTVMVKNIRAVGSSTPSSLTIFNDTLFFSASSGSQGFELWKSDGTEAGTVLVKDINAFGSSSPRLLTVVNETLFFHAIDPFAGSQLWKSDGTEAGTILVKNINAFGSSNPSWLTRVNNTLFFTADDGIHGNELWKSDGTEAGTVMVTDITSTGSSFPSFLTEVNGTLYFTVNDGIHGKELWKSDGTAAGTVLAGDIHPTGSSDPVELTDVNGTLFFWANDSLTGVELWNLDATPSLSFLSDLDAEVTIDGPADIFWLGDTVSSAGDFNGDGLDDIVVASSTGNSSGTGGVVYVFFGRNTTDPINFQSEADADVILRGQNGNEGFGWSVASAGDFNGDGLDDIIVGVPESGYNGQSSPGSAYIFFGRNPVSQITLIAELDADVIIDGQDANDFIGNSVDSAGDFNGDGLDDVIIGAVSNDNNGVTHFGSAFIFFGRTPTAQLLLRSETDANVILNGQNALDFFGSRVSSAGDFNGDGLDDVIVAAEGDDNNGLTDSGSAFIFFGQNPASQIILTADADANVVIDGPTSNVQFGRATRSAGDFNGDGLGDVVVTSFANSSTGISGAGRAFIFFGQNPTGQIQFMADAGANIILDGQIENGAFGIDANSAGDFNGDGLDDVIVGQVEDNRNQGTSVGSAFIFFGQNTADQLILGASDYAEIIMDGIRSSDSLGESVASAGDFNGDGLDDVVIGAFGYLDPAFENSVGRAYVVLGKNTDLPIIHLFGDNPATVEARSTFIPFGAAAQDFVDGDLTDDIVEGPLDTNILGSQTVTYDVTNSRGFSDHKERIVNVVDTTPPVIDLIGNSPKLVEIGTPYNDLGAIATDNLDGDVTANIVVGGLPVNTSVLGSNTVTYDVTDSSGNAAHAERIVTVINTAPPVITILGDNPATVEVGASYTDAGATALDNMNGDLTASIIVGGLPIDTSVQGTHAVTYDVTDASGNTVREERTVNVIDTTPPVITLLGSNPTSVESGAVYTDAGATASDNLDGDLTSSITVGGLPIDTSVLGAYTITYNVTDSLGNTAAQVTRTVNVVDTTAPWIIPLGTIPATVEVGTTYADAGAVATDGVDGDLTSSIVVGGLPIDTSVVGTHAVTYNVTDSSGNAAIEVTRTVNVVDSTSPIVTAPANVTVQATGTSTPVAIGTATATDNVSVASITSNAPAAFPLGLTVVTWTATDTSGNTGTATQNVTVQDTTAPVVTAPANVTAEATGTTTTVTIGTATATDNVAIASIISNALAAFPVGTTVVTWTATDTSGNTATATQNVTVQDTTAPAITLLGSNPVTVQGGTSYADAGATATDTVDGNLTTSIVVNGLPINTNVVGSYTVTYNVTDSSGNAAAQVSRTVNVVDATPPVVTPPADVTVNQTGDLTPVTIGTATATDNVAIASITNDAPASFPVGTTVVTWTATDTSGNPASATQQVTVNPVPLVQLQLLRDYKDSLGLPSGLNRNLNRKLNRAETAIQDGNNNRAKNKLNAFILKVQDNTPQPISQSDADEMIQRAQAIIALL